MFSILDVNFTMHEAEFRRRSICCLLSNGFSIMRTDYLVGLFIIFYFKPHRCFTNCRPENPDCLRLTRTQGTSEKCGVQSHSCWNILTSYLESRIDFRKRRRTKTKIIFSLQNIHKAKVKYCKLPTIEL